MPPPRHQDRLVQSHKAVFSLADGPLDGRTAQLVKLSIAIGMQHEGAEHARKALDAGCTPGERRHAAVLATTTLGFPRMMAAYTWIDDVLAEHGGEKNAESA
ncbi:MAG TPA: carboxymuconolactone decarboxylase family protein [Rhodothermales bacterium]|nr:carboxymuconolactone decarboxylase family protein [Rhodothermales bacterium]